MLTAMPQRMSTTMTTEIEPRRAEQGLAGDHAIAAGARCTRGDDGCCKGCGVAMTLCDVCVGIGYHRAGCEGRRTRVLSLGGGLDSWVVLLEAVRRGEPPDVVVFADVTDPERLDPGEWPSTYRHLDEVVRPFCAAHAIELVVLDTVRYPVRDARSLFAWMWDRGQIPVAGPNRICTTVAKVERFERWMDDRFGGRAVEVWIGFEAGEEDRAAKDPNAGKPRRARGLRMAGITKNPFAAVANGLRWTRSLAFAATSARRHNRFPLIEWGICRCRAQQIAEQSGLPVPRKSACMGCPYGSRGDWQTLAVEQPDVLARFAELERRKPLTSNGRKLSIMGYDSRTQTGTPLPVYVSRPYRPRPKPCRVCGAAVRATKATGCGYLVDGAGESAA